MKNIIKVSLLLGSVAFAKHVDYIDHPFVKKYRSISSTTNKFYKKMKKSEKNYNVVGFIDEGQMTSTSVRYELDNILLKPNRCLYFEVPEKFWDKPVIFVSLSHTQDGNEEKILQDWDESPALSSFQVNQVGKKMKANWRYWGGRSSGAYGAKYAAPTHMESEGLYEWYKHGHLSVESREKSIEELYINMARLCSIGVDPVVLGGVRIKFSPKRSAYYSDVKIAKNYNMGDQITAKKRSYGLRYNGVELKKDGKSNVISERVSLVDGRIEMLLKEGEKLNSLEVSISDKKDGGQSGFAKLDAYILRANKKIMIIDKENVPPQGVLLGSPFIDNFIVKKGDKLVMESKWDTSYVMGFRVGYLD